MGNNNEIRKRMEIYRSILLAVVWIGAVVGMIVGLVMIAYETGGSWYSSSSAPLRPYGIALLIVSIFGGIIGHFLVNVGLAIPFILLNNGDILEKTLRKANAISFDYIVSKNLNLRSDPNFDSEIFTEMEDGDEVLFLEKGKETTFENVTAPWFKVKNEDEIIGWCFSGFLRKK